MPEPIRTSEEAGLVSDDLIEDIVLGQTAVETEGYTVELRPELADVNTRLDKFVTASLDGLSRGYVQRLIDEGLVRVDGVVRRPAFKLTPGEVVVVEVPPTKPEVLEPEPIPLNIVYEDADLIVLNKRAGMVVHPAPGHTSGTLVNALLAHAPEISIAGTNRPGIVHRLDKDTSGLMVVAKTDRARTSLVAQWGERAVRKEYVALVRGVVEPDEATIDAPIRRDPQQRQRMSVLRDGREAVTHISVRERFSAATLLNVQIETGRTHQIRVHLAFIGHPVVGDAVYGRGRGGGLPIKALAPERQFLHASRLGFRLPDGTAVEFESELPPDLAAVLAALREEHS